MTGFAGKTILITGAASGIGLETALRFAAAGANLVLADRNEEAGAAAALSCAALGATAIFVPLDVTDAAACMGVVDTARERFGRLDCAFNNAGISVGMVGGRANLADCPLEAWRAVIDINLTGVFNCLRAEIPAMLDAGGGAIVNTASTAGLISLQQTGPYVAAKHGVVGLTRLVCDEYAHRGIRCNAVAPGVTATPMTTYITTGDRAEGHLSRIPAGRFGTAGDIAGAVLFLCSPDSAYINGVTLPVDGGYTAR